MSTIESKVADVMLERPVTVMLGGKRIACAQPSIATLILVSEEISKLPNIDSDPQKAVQTMLFSARDLKPIGRILAMLIVGAKPSFMDRLIPKRRERKINKIARNVLMTATPREVRSATMELLGKAQLSDFFVLTTSLTEMNLTKATREVV